LLKHTHFISYGSSFFCFVSLSAFALRNVHAFYLDSGYYNKHSYLLHFQSREQEINEL